ncbi:T9SS type A sorting domain-containing protein [Pontibacter sp. G13]|uniref:T9SS type A sorting domain-containing protein n=1 Tax=Pontibacter sp. G13 TaxID=3074898 RepID=UPI00288C08F6|nr:T9SS type A sorting domain-containing protein [Pontibacter sp. G13]WNJ20061.1 T9SS type A sorting domain-containing protein [Pontibacter sp. G13]
MTSVLLNCAAKRIKASVFLMLMAALPQLLQAATYYVSPTGDNTADGSMATPFQTIQHAADMMAYGDSCIVQAGTYRETITVNTNGLTFLAADGQEVLISGYEIVDTWTSLPNNIWLADLGWSLADKNQVMYRGQMMNLARWPNKTNFNPFDHEAYKAFGNNNSINHNDIPQYQWQTGGVVFFLGKNRWTSWRVPITGVTNGKVSFGELSSDWSYGGSHNPANGGEFFLMNVFQALDAPGEWYINHNTKKVYFITPDGQAPEAGEVLVRKRPTAFNINNRQDITIDGFHIEGSNIHMPGAKNCVIQHCEILYGNHTIGTNGSFQTQDASIFMNDGCQGNLITHNNIQWGAGNGIILKGQNNIVSHNYIGHFDYLSSYASPIELRGTNELIYNEIFAGGRDLVRGGGDGSTVAYNDMHHSNITNDDCGPIYFCCGQYGYTRIHHNWIHDCQSRDKDFGSYKATGVYLDNTTENVIVDHNVLWGLEWTGVQINWAGKNLLIYNNTIWTTGQPESKAMGRWVNGYQLDNVQVHNTLANEPELHFTSADNNVIVGLNEQVFMDFEGTDFTPKGNSPAIDAGKVIPGYTDGYLGVAPDAGAYEDGVTPWVPGPDWELEVTVVSNDARLETTIPVKIYPNPYQGELLRIESPLPGTKSVRIFDLNGKLIHTDSFDGQMMSLDSIQLTEGIYLFEISHAAGVSREKIIVQ